MARKRPGKRGPEAPAKEKRAAGSGMHRKGLYVKRDLIGRGGEADVYRCVHVDYEEGEEAVLERSGSTVSRYHSRRDVYALKVFQRSLDWRSIGRYQPEHIMKVRHSIGHRI